MASEEGIIVAIPGDTILCPEGCPEPLARFIGETFRREDILPGGRLGADGETLWCRRCGSGACRPPGSGRIEQAGRFGPRILVRSGDWTGWRALGGE